MDIEFKSITLKVPNSIIVETLKKLFALASVNLLRILNRHVRSDRERRDCSVGGLRMVNRHK